MTKTIMRSMCNYCYYDHNNNNKIYLWIFLGDIEIKGKIISNMKISSELLDKLYGHMGWSFYKHGPIYGFGPDIDKKPIYTDNLDFFEKTSFYHFAKNKYDLVQINTNRWSGKITDDTNIFVSNNYDTYRFTLYTDINTNIHQILNIDSNIKYGIICDVNKPTLYSGSSEYINNTKCNIYNCITYIIDTYKPYLIINNKYHYLHNYNDYQLSMLRNVFALLLKIVPDSNIIKYQSNESCVIL